MKQIFLSFILLCSTLLSAQTLKFGAISTVDAQLMEKKLTPLMNYIEKALGKKVVFETGYNYQDTINKFADGTYDLGFIGPSPYVSVHAKNPNALKIVAGLVNEKKHPFQSVIIAKKGSKIQTMQDLKEKRFAFGSPNSTLSYYIPMYMLKKNKLESELNRYDFLGRHDKVAQYVIMGKYDAGAVKKSIADKYENYIQIVAQSKPLKDFLIVVSQKCSDETYQKLQKALLNMPNIEPIKKLKKHAIGLEKRSYEDYAELEKIMKFVEEKQ